MIPLFGSCKLVFDYPKQDPLLERDLHVGDRGAVIEIYDDGAAYAVEFFDDDGNSIGIAWLKADQVRPVTESQPAAN